MADGETQKAADVFQDGDTLVQGDAAEATEAFGAGLMADYEANLKKLAAARSAAREAAPTIDATYTQDPSELGLDDDE